MKNLLISLSWILATLGLYAALVVLEFLWNVPAWEPNAGVYSWLLIGGVAVLLAAFWCLGRASVNLATRLVSLVACLCLVGLAIYIMPAEPLKTGLFARLTASPLWYRGGRSLAMALPAVFWVMGWVRSRARASLQTTVEAAD